MKNSRNALWLLLFSQAMFLVGSLLDPPTSLLLIILRVGVPIAAILFIGWLLYNQSREK